MKFEIMVKSHRPQSSVMLYKIPNELIITILHFDVDWTLKFRFATRVEKSRKSGKSREFGKIHKKSRKVGYF